MALLRCTVWSGMPPGVLCGAVQELHRCLTPLVKQGDLLDIKMLDMAKKDTMAPPVPTEEACSSEPRAEEPIGLPAPEEPPASEPEEAADSEELALVQRRRPLTHPGFTLSWVYESNPPPRGCSFTGQYTQGDSVGPELFGDPAGDSLS